MICIITIEESEKHVCGQKAPSYCCGSRKSMNSAMWLVEVGRHMVMKEHCWSVLIYCIHVWVMTPVWANISVVWSIIISNSWNSIMTSESSHYATVKYHSTNVLNVGPSTYVLDPAETKCQICCVVFIYTLPPSLTLCSSYCYLHLCVLSGMNAGIS